MTAAVGARTALALHTLLAAACASPPPRTAPVAPTPSSFRWVANELAERVALLSCPTVPGAPCRELARFDVDGARVGAVAAAPGGDGLAVQRIADDGGCTLALFDKDGAVPPREEWASCNAGKGDMLWLDDAHLWLSGGARTGGSFAQLVSPGGTQLWSATAIAIELSPTGRYALVGSSTVGGATINTVDVVDLLAGGVSITTLPVQGDALTATWSSDAVTLSWAGSSAFTVSAPGAGAPLPRGPLPNVVRPFSGR